MKLSYEQIENAASRGTTDYGRVKCLYADDQFALVKWPGGSFWSGMGGQSYCSPYVERYRMSTLRKAAAGNHGAHGGGREVWNCARDKNGALTVNRKLELIEREQGREICIACGEPFKDKDVRVTTARPDSGASHERCYG